MAIIKPPTSLGGSKPQSPPKAQQPPVDDPPRPDIPPTPMPGESDTGAGVVISDIGLQVRPGVVQDLSLIHI